MGRRKRKWAGSNDDFCQPTFMEKHYTIPELAAAWHIGVDRLRRFFATQDDVVRWGEAQLRKGRKQIYTSVRVPESVARRSYLRLISGAGDEDGAK